MSGIAGIFYLDGRPVDRALLQEMTAAIAHRGPDAEGLWVQGAVGLGHRQLRTTAESLNEHQPLSLAAGDYAITFSGRVDNREELIRDLGPLARIPSDAADVELVLRAYIAWGDDCVKRITGDFAFAIWDNRRQRLFCGRDPLGMEPLYYYYDGRRFIFGSEIKEILLHPGVPRQLNELMVGLYLRGNFGELEQTFYQGILRLPAGYSLTVDRLGMTRECFWSPDTGERIILASDDEYVERFRELFLEAVRCRLRSANGRIGATVSGGLDSSSAACAAEHLIRTGKTSASQIEIFSTVFPGVAGADESSYVQDIVNHYGIKAHLVPSNDFWGLKPVRGQYPLRDQPMPIPYQARHEAILEEIRASGIGVALTGEGGDEGLNVAWGYFWDLFWGFKFSRFFQEMSYLTLKSKWLFYKRLALSVIPRPAREVYSYLRGTGDETWINSAFAGRMGLDDYALSAVPRPNYRSVHSRQEHAALVWMGRAPFFGGYINQRGLNHNLESRHPFLDLRVLEFLARIPPEQKFHAGWKKLILRRAMEGILPESIRLRRDKASFAPLMKIGMAEREAERLQGLIDSSMLAQLGYVDIGKVGATFQRYRTDPNAPELGLLLFFTMEEWLRQAFHDLLSHQYTTTAMPAT